MPIEPGFYVAMALGLVAAVGIGHMITDRQKRLASIAHERARSCHRLWCGYERAEHMAFRVTHKTRHVVFGYIDRVDRMAQDLEMEHLYPIDAIRVTAIRQCAGLEVVK